MIVELNEKDLRAIRSVLSCINEDTDELDDADLPVGMDREEYHKQKSKQSTLKSKVIEVWKAWAERLASNIKPLRPMSNVWRSGGNKEGEMIYRYEKMTGSKFQHSNKIDELTFFACILSAANTYFIDRAARQLTGVDLAEKIMGIYRAKGTGENNPWFEKFLTAAKDGKLANEYLNFVKEKYPNEYSTLSFIAEDEKFIELLHKCICNLIDAEDEDCFIVINLAAYLLAMNSKQRKAMFDSFISSITQERMYRVLEVYYDAPEIERSLKNKYFKMDGRRKIDKQKFDFLKQNGAVRKIAKQASIDLKNPGKSWSWKSSNWEGNCTLIAENDAENIDMTMSAICLGFWSIVAPDFNDYRGEREVRVLDETKVNVINVEFSDDSRTY